MATYLLDTNTISFLLRGNHGVVKRLQKRPLSEMCLSPVSKGELFLVWLDDPKLQRCIRL